MDLPVEDRLRALVERGWRPTLATHLVPPRHPWVKELGLVVRHEAGYAAWIVYMRPGDALRRAGAVSRVTTMAAFVDDALALAEGHADVESERITRQ